MKTVRQLIGLALLMCGVALSSCFSHNNHGYPEKVSFSKKGGTQTIVGEICLSHIEINEYNGEGTYCYLAEDEDTARVTYKWLTVELVKGSNTITLTAEPMTGKKKRKLYLSADFIMDMIEITVKQQK